MHWSTPETPFEDLSWTDPDYDHAAWENGIGGVGYEADPVLPRIRILADSEADWSTVGAQGLHGWLAGYYQPAIDPDRGFDCRRDFELDPKVWRFSGGTWVLDGDNGALLSMGRDYCEWSADGGMAGIWGIKRWISGHTGTASIMVSGGSAVQPTHGGLQVFHNGRLAWRSYPGQSEQTNASIQIEVNLAHGDTIDVACVPPESSGSTNTNGAAVFARVRVLETLDRLDPMADSVADWITGDQGENGWNYGYYPFPGVSDKGYDPSQLVLSGSTWNMIDNSWQLGSETNPRQRPPWDRISQVSMHPGTGGGGRLRWVVRRWTSDQAGEFHAMVSLSKQSSGGNGVTAHVCRNGERLWSYTLPGHDTIGIRALIPIGELQPGDQIDFALDPRGTDGIAVETVDGTFFQASLYSGVCDAGKDLAPFVATALPEVPTSGDFTCYLRYPFVLDASSLPDQLRLRVCYKDALVAYLNGIPAAALPDMEIGQTNGTPFGTSPSARPTPEAIEPEMINLDHLIPHLRKGSNVLAFQVLVAPASRDSFVLQPELLANHAPEASTMHVSVEQPLDAVLSVTGVAQTAIDSDGDSIVFLGAGPSETTAEGAVVHVQRGWIRYTPAPGFSGEDSFLVTVADTFGLLSTGRVMVTVGSDTMPPRIHSAHVSSDRLQVALKCSEPVDPELTTASAGYQFSPTQSVTSIQFLPTLDTIILSLDRPLAEDEDVSVMVTGLVDASGNAMNPQEIPVWQTAFWPTPDPAPYRTLVETFAIPNYHQLRFSYGEWLADYHPDGDYLNMGKYIRYVNAIHDAEGVPLYAYGGNCYNPSRVQIHALAMHGKWLAGEDGARERFLAAVNRLLTLQDDRGAFLYPFDYRHHFNNTLLTAGWTSALAQGFGLSVLSRAYRLTDDERYLAAGEAALNYLLLSTDEGGPTTTLEALHPSLASYVWHEEWPVSPPPYTLNGFMFTLLGLYDWGELPIESAAVERARKAFEEGMATLSVVLPYFDIGGFTAYDLRHLLIGATPLPADDYHAVHVGTIHALRKISRSRPLHEAELTWAAHVERPTRLAVHGPTAAQVDDVWPLSVCVTCDGEPVETGTKVRRDFMGDVLSDGLSVHATVDRSPLSASTDHVGEANFSVRIPAQYGEPTRVTVDITFGGWGEYQPSADRLELEVAGSGVLVPRARCGPGYLAVDWDPHPSELITGYSVYRSDSAEGLFTCVDPTPLPVSATTFEDFDVIPGRSYWYRITALGVDEGGADFSSVITVTMPTPNLPPVMVGEVPELWPLVAGGPVPLRLSDWFTDPTSDLLTFVAHSSDPFVLDVSIEGADLTLIPLKAGDAWITVSADDGHNPLLEVVFRALVYPQAHRLADAEFTFTHWDPSAPQGEYPEHMFFVQSDVNDPGLETPLLFPYFVPEEDYHPADGGTVGFPYNNTQGTRLNGLGADGISLVNAGGQRDLGGVLLALDTREIGNGQVGWTAATIEANLNVYGLRLQYRVGVDGPFIDVVVDGDPAEYITASLPETVTFDSIRLPANALGQEYVQLLWRFYAFDGIGGTGAQLRLDDIAIAPFMAGPRDPILVWPEPQPIQYGTALGEQQLTASADVPGAFAYRPPAETRLPAGFHLIEATFTPSDPITHNVLKTNVVLRVDPAPLIVRAEWGSRSYGDENPPFTYIVEGLMGEDGPDLVTGVTLRCQANSESPVGYYPINAEGGAAPNYVVGHYGGLLIVLPVVPELSWFDPPPVVQGTALSEEQLNAVAGFPGTLTYEPAPGVMLPAGPHSLRVTFTPDDPLNYSTATAQVELIVLPAPPALTQHPVSQIVLRGSSIACAVEVDGLAPLTYQWLKDGESIPGANEPILEIENAQSTDAGAYRVAVTNPGGSVQSEPAHLTVVSTHLSRDQPPLRAVITIAGSIGNRYRIDSVDAWGPPEDWSPGVPFTLDSPIIDIMDDSSLSVVHRFHRVIQLPDP